MCRDPKILLAEDYIVWLRDPTDFRYLRETVVWFRERVRFPKSRFTNSIVAAYAVLRADARTGDVNFLRRMWWIDPRRDPYPDPKTCPTEAVVPVSITAGEPSLPMWEKLRLIERARAGV